MSKCTRCGSKSHSKGQKCPAIKAECFGCNKIGHYQQMCFKTAKANCNALKCEDSDSDKQDIDDKIFLGTLIAEQCTVNCVDPSQVDTLSMQKSNKACFDTLTLMLKRLFKLMRH